MSNENLLREIESQIMECHGMIDHFIALNDRDEIRYWRRMLQGCKVRKRQVKKQMQSGGMAG